MSVALPKAMFEQVHRLCKLENRTQSELVREALRRYADAAVEEQIKRRAHDLYVRGECKDGHDREHWLQADQEVRRILSEASVSPVEVFLDTQPTTPLQEGEAHEDKTQAHSAGKSE